MPENEHCCFFSAPSISHHNERDKQQRKQTISPVIFIVTFALPYTLFFPGGEGEERYESSLCNNCVHSRGFNLWATTGVLGQFTHVFAPDRWEGKAARNRNALENNSDSRVEKLRHAAGVQKIDCDHRQVVAPVKTQSSVALSHSTRITPTQTVVAHRLGYKAKSSRPSPHIATPASQ